MARSGFLLRRLYRASVKYFLMQEADIPESTVQQHKVRTEIFSALLDASLDPSVHADFQSDAGQIGASLHRDGEGLKVHYVPLSGSCKLQVGELCLDPASKCVTVSGKLAKITPMEFTLLEFLMEHPQQTFTTGELLELVWHYPLGSGRPDLVRVTIGNLRKKIEPVPTVPVYVRTVPGFGYCVGSPSAESV